MTSDEANYLARMGYAEQIGEARGHIGCAIVFLTHCSVSDNPTILEVIRLLTETEAMLQELRHVPTRTVEELEASVDAAVARVQATLEQGQ